MKRNNKYDILLTYPSKKFRLFDNMIPLGLASIAAILEENNYKVKIVDFDFYKGDFRIDLKYWNPKIIGIGGTTFTRKGSFLTARLVKEVFSNIPVVYGGVHATFTAEDSLKNVPFIDYIIKGEGEYTFLSLCNKFVRNRDVDIFSLDGLCYRKDNGIIENKPSRINDLDSLPIYTRHLFGSDYRMKIDFLGLEADFLITSRGCPMSCSFCSASKMFPGGVRFRSMSHIQKEIEVILAGKNIKALKIFDSTFTSSDEHVLNFCKMIKPYHLLWECEIRADTVDKNLLKAMKDAGCFYIDMGLETTNEKLLKEMNKNITVKQVDNVLDWCRELGIKTKIFFIFGNLGQTYEDCKKDVKYIKMHRNQIDFYANKIGLWVLPGTSLEKKVKEKNLMPKDFSWARFRPPLKNLLCFELGDVFLLEQKQLSFYKLFIIALKLQIQRTSLSPEFIRKILLKNIRGLINIILSKLQYTRHTIKRKLFKL